MGLGLEVYGGVWGCMGGGGFEVGRGKGGRWGWRGRWAELAGGKHLKREGF